MKYSTCRVRNVWHNRRHYNFSLKKNCFFVINKINSETINDYNSDKEGMDNCSFTSTIVVELMQLLMVLKFIGPCIILIVE